MVKLGNSAAEAQWASFVSFRTLKSGSMRMQLPGRPLPTGRTRLSSVVGQKPSCPLITAEDAHALPGVPCRCCRLETRLPADVFLFSGFGIPQLEKHGVDAARRGIMQMALRNIRREYGESNGVNRRLRRPCLVLCIFPMRPAPGYGNTFTSLGGTTVNPNEEMAGEADSTRATDGVPFVKTYSQSNWTTAFCDYGRDAGGGFFPIYDPNVPLTRFNWLSVEVEMREPPAIPKIVSARRNSFCGLRLAPVRGSAGWRDLRRTRLNISMNEEQEST